MFICEIILAIAAVATFCGAVFIGTGALTVIITGTGILWRKVKQDSNGNIVQSFDQDTLIWRFDPIFRGTKLRSYDVF